MIKDGKEAPDPCTQVLTDLTKFLNEKRDEGCGILVMVDANESSSKEGSKWKAFLTNNALEGLHEYTLDNLPPTTRIGSTTRIDCMAATEGILQEVQAAGFRALHEGIISDHIMGRHQSRQFLWRRRSVNNSTTIL